MTGQLSLDDVRPTARRTDPETSHLAARSVRGRAKQYRQECLAALIAAGDEGLTDFQLGEIVGRQQTSAGKRRHELVGLGLVEWTGGYRPSPSGCSARVWRAKRGA